MAFALRTIHLGMMLAASFGSPVTLFAQQELAPQLNPAQTVSNAQTFIETYLGYIYSITGFHRDVGELNTRPYWAKGTNGLTVRHLSNCSFRANWNGEGQIAFSWGDVISVRVMPGQHVRLDIENFGHIDVHLSSQEMTSRFGAAMKVLSSRCPKTVRQLGF